MQITVTHASGGSGGMRNRDLHGWCGPSEQIAHVIM